MIEIVARTGLSEEADTIAVFFFDGLEPESSSAPTVDWNQLARLGFTAKLGQVQTLVSENRKVIAIGLGRRQEVDATAYRKAAGVAARAAKGSAELTLFAGAQSRAVGEGLLLGSYKFTAHKSAAEESPLARVDVIGADETELAAGAIVGQATNFARDLINEPPSMLTPTVMAHIASDVAAANDLQVEVWNRERIITEQLGGLLGVSEGSDEPPCLVKLVYEPQNADEQTKTIALVGKGITFDSGGLNIKPGDSMVDMKTDMSGAAAVLATMSCLSELHPNVRVRAFLPITENMLGSGAMKPGDVLRARNGKTMEVINTDAEGRLVLADALSLAVESEVDAIVDLATLTGACKVALGNDIAGLFGTNDELLERIQTSSTNVNELVWRLPLHDRYKKLIESNVADIKNQAGVGGGGLITSALFLREFTGDTPWAHLDIAGTARGEGDDALFVKGGTGYGVRLLVDLVCNYAG